jgi:hypothetical protein
MFLEHVEYERGYCLINSWLSMAQLSTLSHLTVAHSSPSVCQLAG